MFEALPTFVAVADSGSFSRTASAQGVAVSSITRRIELLETELKVKLFTRSSRRLSLTDAGEHLLPRARNILAEMAEAKEGLTALSVDPRGILTVTAPAMFGRRHVAPALVSFLKKYPLVEVELHSSDEIVDLAGRHIDVAIRIGALVDSDLMITQLAPAHRIVCASPAYLDLAGHPKSPLDLLNHNCLTLALRSIPAGWWCFAGVNRDQALKVRGNLRSDDTGILTQAAVDGLGIVDLANWLVSDMIEAGRLVQLFPDIERSKSASPTVYAVRMLGRSNAVKSKLLVDHLRAYFGSPPYWAKI